MVLLRDYKSIMGYNSLFERFQVSNELHCLFGKLQINNGLQSVMRDRLMLNVRLLSFCHTDYTYKKDFKLMLGKRLLLFCHGDNVWVVLQRSASCFLTLLPRGSSEMFEEGNLEGYKVFIALVFRFIGVLINKVVRQKLRQW